MSEKVYINGDFVSIEKARINASDFGLTYGWGLFETMQSYNGKVFLFAEHLKRLALGAKALDIRSSHLKKLTQESEGGPVAALLKLNKLTTRTAYIKIIVTKGSKNATIIIFARATDEEKNAQLRRGGAKAILIDEPGRYKPDIKSLNYLPNILAREEAKKKDAYDAIYKTSKGLILEASASNIFIIKGKRVITPPADGLILPGITREKVIKIAKEAGLTLLEAPIKTNDLIGSDEAFLTNSIIEVLPLIKIESNSIAGGKPGEITKRLQLLYRAAANLK